MDGVDALGRPVVVLNAGKRRGAPSLRRSAMNCHRLLPSPHQRGTARPRGPACLGSPTAPTGCRPSSVQPSPPLRSADAVPANMKSSALIFVKAHLEPLVNQASLGGQATGSLQSLVDQEGPVLLFAFKRPLDPSVQPPPPTLCLVRSEMTSYLLSCFPPLRPCRATMCWCSPPGAWPSCPPCG